MKERRFFYVPSADSECQLPVDEAVHAVRVLRLVEGDEIFLMDGRGNFYASEITLVTKSKCLYEIKEKIPQQKTWQGRIHLAIAPTKLNDRMEWMLEKITEIGFDEITFLDCEFSERHSVKTDRFERIAVSAMKQSRKGWKPLLNGLIPFAKFLEMPRSGGQFIAHCYDDIDRNDLFKVLSLRNKADEITIMIGPEGDFSREEVFLAQQKGFQSITLGESRLRTETAGLATVMIAQMLKRNSL